MNTAAVAMGILIGLTVGTLADLVSEEVRGRLDRLPHWLIRLAGRRLDPEIREDAVGEWIAELQMILDIHRAGPLPITRLIIGTRYALGLLRVGGTINRDLRPSRRQRGSARHVAKAVCVALIRDLDAIARRDDMTTYAKAADMVTFASVITSLIFGVAGIITAVADRIIPAAILITPAAISIITVAIGRTARQRDRRPVDREQR